MESEERRFGEKSWHEEAYGKLLGCIAYRIEFKKLKQGNETIIKKVVEGVSKALK